VSTNHYFSESADSELNPKPIPVKLAGQNITLFTDRGVFSPEHLDAGTEALLRQLDTVKPQGRILDIGCGWGPIAIAIAMANPESKVTAIDVNKKCLALTKLNAESLNLKNIHVGLPDEISASDVFDEIWSNPPIRVGKQVLHQILETWLPRLTIGGIARLVVQKNLGADSLQRWISEKFEGYEVSRIDTVKGFRILKIVKN